jgi:hypothetical protein
VKRIVLLGCLAACVTPRGGERANRHSAGFFLVMGGSLVPLGCWDAPAAQYLEGGRCLELVPENDAVMLDGSTAVESGLHGSIVQCPAGKAPQSGLAVRNVLPRQIAAARFATWPARDAPGVRAPAPFAGDAAERARIEEAIRRSAPWARGPAAITALLADLDGDGREDRIWAATVPKEGAVGIDPAFSGILWSPARAPEELLVLSRDERVKLDLLGAVELSGEGGALLWLARNTEHGTIWTLERHASGQLERIGRIACIF